MTRELPSAPFEVWLGLQFADDASLQTSSSNCHMLQRRFQPHRSKGRIGISELAAIWKKILSDVAKPGSLGHFFVAIRNNDAISTPVPAQEACRLAVVTVTR
jgi:hypothetical protein